jgi:DNA-binding winged helix-turn-helix (wHTH) protein
MPMTDRPTYRFQPFELNLGAYELLRDGRRVPLERRPMDLLILLVERRGELVTRAEIVERLWGKDVFIQVETGINTLIRKIRRALGDSPDAPVFVETVQGKGYRFVAQVDRMPAFSFEPAAMTAAAERRRLAGRPWRALTALLAVVAVIGAMALWQGLRPAALPRDCGPAAIRVPAGRASRGGRHVARPDRSRTPRGRRTPGNARLCKQHRITSRDRS